MKSTFILFWISGGKLSIIEEFKTLKQAELYLMWLVSEHGYPMNQLYVDEYMLDKNTKQLIMIRELIRKGKKYGN